MSLEELSGLELQPFVTRIAPEKVAEYVSATSDAAVRWQDAAPPSYAGALLFMAAPLLLERDDVRAHTKVLVHVDQRFVWHAPLSIGSDVTIESGISKVRSRGASTFVTFDVAVIEAGGRLLDSTSTFLLGKEPAAEPGPDRGEPAARLRGPNEVPSLIRQADVDSALPALKKSASRIDLVRYAGASGDFNPIHYDHEAARAAGLDGIVVHGLLMGAWMSQLASALSPRPDPLAELRLRFRLALRPGVAAAVTGRVAAETEDAAQQVDLSIVAGDAELVTGHATLRSG